MEISKFLKMAFLIDALIAFAYGFIMLLLPEQHATFFAFPYEEFADRFIGSLFLALGFGNLLAYRASSWENVEIVIYMNMTFFILGIGVMLYSMAVALIPIAGFVQVGLMSFLFILFLYAYYEAKMKT